MHHSDVQIYVCYKNVIDNHNFSYTGSHKKLQEHFVLYLEMTERVFLVEVCVF